MAFRKRKSRDRYLHLLASDPLFRDVPRPHIVVLGRLVDMLELAPGAAITCDATREIVIVADGHALATDLTVGEVAAVGPCTAVSAGRWRLVAATPVRVFVVGRRELQTVAALAPRVARLIADTRTRSQASPRPHAAVARRP